MGKCSHPQRKQKVFLVFTSPVEDLHAAGQEVQFTEALITGDQRKQEGIRLWTPLLPAPLPVCGGTHSSEGVSPALGWL